MERRNPGANVSMQDKENQTMNKSDHRQLINQGEACLAPTEKRNPKNGGIS